MKIKSKYKRNISELPNELLNHGAGVKRVFLNKDDSNTALTQIAWSCFKPGEYCGMHTHLTMDGKGRWVDNVFIERLWRSLKYEEVYLKAYDTPKEAKEGIGEWMREYNHDRPHQSLEYQTPESVYLASMPKKEMAA